MRNCREIEHDGSDIFIENGKQRLLMMFGCLAIETTRPLIDNDIIHTAFFHWHTLTGTDQHTSASL
jgi:hypothetical protein